MKIIRLIILLPFILMLGCNSGQKVNNITGNANLHLSDIKLKDPEGNPLTADRFSGKTVFLNFWATWCRPCVEELPSVKKLKELLKNEPVEFLFASDETAERVAAFEEKHRYNFNYAGIRSFTELNIMVIPTTFIFDRNGKLVFSETGYRKWDSRKNIDLIRDIINAK